MSNRLYKILLPLVLLSILIGLLLFWSIGNQPKVLEVDFLDVGQGDAILIKTPYGQNILIDGGPNSAVINQLSKNLPWWDRTLDLVILTHPHSDHVDGLNNVLERYKVKQVLTTGVLHNTPGYISFLELIKNQHLPLTIVDRPQIISFGQDCRLNILSPTGSYLNKETDNINNTSIVARLEYGKTNFLLMGDIETKTENGLLEQPVNLAAQVLKVSHHGSNLSTSEAFLTAVVPQIAVIEVGKDNSFSHPSPRIVKRLERINTKIFRTDLDGTVRIISDGNEVKKEN